MVKQVLVDWLQLYLKNNNDYSYKNEWLSKLTVVIPSYERQDYIVRQIARWSNSSATVLIMDGSSRPIDVSIKKIISTLQNIHYYHSNNSIFSRLEEAASMINTPYSVFLGDDEFILNSAVYNILSVLENNKDVSACFGMSIAFRPSVDGSKIKYYESGYAMPGYSVDSDDLDERLQYAMRTYNAATSYAVLRSEVWKSSWVMHAWSTAHAGELFQAISTYIQGKLVTVDDLYFLSSRENTPVNIQGKHDRGVLFKDWWRGREYLSERNIYLDQLQRLFPENMLRKSVDNKHSIEKAVNAYLDKNNRPWLNFLSEKCGVNASVVKAINAYVNYYLSKLNYFRVITKRYSARVLFSVIGKNDFLYVDGFRGVKINKREFGEIEKLIHGFYVARNSSSDNC